jgi:hypothetical protein
MSQGPDIYGGHGHEALDTEGLYPDTPVGQAKMPVRQALSVFTGVLGVASWAVGLTGVPGFGLAVTLSVLTAGVAVTGVLPGQGSRGWLATAVAVTAFADAVTSTVATGAATWAPIVIDVLLALQVVATVAALLLEPRESPSAPAAPENDYAAYARYVQAYQDYAEYYGRDWPEQYAEDDADAMGHGQAGAMRAADQDSRAAMEAKYTQYAGSTAPLSSEDRSRHADETDAGHPGMPGMSRASRAEAGAYDFPTGSAPMAPGAY